MNAFTGLGLIFALIWNGFPPTSGVRKANLADAFLLAAVLFGFAGIVAEIVA